MTDISPESEQDAVKRTLESTYCPEPIHEARGQQDRLLLERLGGGCYRIADIGCGNGYHAVMLAEVAELYHGFEISPAIAETARRLWQSEGIDHAKVIVGDVAEVELEEASYDLVLCLYFTPGNFREKSDDLSLYTDAYLERNPQFVRVISRFYRALAPCSSMFLTVYQDVPEAEAAQFDYYEQTGQHVLTPSGSPFVATAEGFWSARWTKARMLSNLDACEIDRDHVEFTELNSISWLVEIKK